MSSSEISSMLKCIVKGQDHERVSFGKEKVSMAILQFSWNDFIYTTCIGQDCMQQSIVLIFPMCSMEWEEKQAAQPQAAAIREEMDPAQDTYSKIQSLAHCISSAT